MLGAAVEDVLCVIGVDTAWHLSSCSCPMRQRDIAWHEQIVGCCMSHPPKYLVNHQSCTRSTSVMWLILHCRSQVFTSVEGFVGARAKLVEAGFKVNMEESNLVFKPNAPVEVRVQILDVRV